MWYYNIFVFQNLREHCVKVYTRYHFRNLPSNSLVSRLLYLSYYSCRIVVCLLHFWMRKNQQFITIIKIYGSMLLRWMRWLISHKRVDNLNFENLWNKLLIQNYFFLITSTMWQKNSMDLRTLEALINIIFLNQNFSFPFPIANR